MSLNSKFKTILILMLAFSSSALAQDAGVAERLEKLETAAAAQSNADNAWMLICSALVLFFKKYWKPSQQ